MRSNNQQEKTPDTENLPPSDQQPAKRLPLLAGMVALLFFLLGLGIRLYDLTDPPLDFHATRQLRGAMLARGMYYEMLPPGQDPERRELAIRLAEGVGEYEPPILEKLVATTYLVMGEEQVWVARLYNSLFWLIGGMALFDLARRLASPGAALVSLGFYLFLPFGVEASRSFQPDPGMTMWIVLSAWSLYRWQGETGAAPRWKWALLAGLLGGMAILIKVVAVYIVGAAALAVVLSKNGFRRALRDPQVWAMVALMIAPAAIFYLGFRSGRAGGYFENWTLDLLHLLLQPTVYARWFNLAQSLMGATLLLLALAGMVIARPSARIFLLGLWLGYGIYGLSLPYQIYTHTYYHIQLIPIVALSLAPIGQVLVEQVSRQGRFWQSLATALMVAAVAFPLFQARTVLAIENHRDAPAYWQEIGALLPADGKILALTQEYGYPLEYYGWRNVSLWPILGERNLADLRGEGKEFETFFANRTEGRRYFLITAFNQFNSQPDLKAMLYDHYPIYAEGNGYLIFDLEHPNS